MMIDHCVAMFVLGAAAATGAALLLTHQPQLRRRTIDEIADFLFDPGQDKLLVSFDPELDVQWQNEGNDRRLQCVRLAIFQDCLGFMLKNVRVLYEWADTERFENQHRHLEYDAALVKAIEDVIAASLLFLRLGRIAKWQLWVLAFSHFEALAFIPVPSIARFRSIGGIDLIDAYKGVAKAAEALTLAHGDVEVITRRIRLCFWTA
jgi:hypothetical protein